MTDAEKLRDALVFHVYATRCMLDAVAALLEATDFDATPADKRKARNAVKRDLQTACRALEQTAIVHTITEAE